MLERTRPLWTSVAPGSVLYGCAGRAHSHWLKSRRQTRGRAESQRSIREKWAAYGPPAQALFPPSLRWSSETWTKASERATVRLDQTRIRFICRFRYPKTLSRCDSPTLQRIGYLEHQDPCLGELSVDTRGRRKVPTSGDSRFREGNSSDKNSTAPGMTRRFSRVMRSSPTGFHPNSELFLTRPPTLWC